MIKQSSISHKTTNLVSRILFLNYHLSGHVITNMILLPTLELRRAAFKRSYTWHYSTQGLPATRVTTGGCELLPHIFTFAPFAWSSYFLWHFLFPVNREAGYSPVGCPVLSGLSLAHCATIVRVCSKYKDTANLPKRSAAALLSYTAQCYNSIG